MLIPKQLPTSKVLLLVSVVVVALGISGYLLYTNFYADSGIGDRVSSVIGKTVGGEDLFAQPLALPQTAGFDANFFTDPSIRILKSYGQVPTTSPGKPDPFTPLPGGVTSLER